MSTWEERMSQRANESGKPRLSCDRCGNPVVGPCSWTNEGVICSNCEVVDHEGFLEAMGQVCPTLCDPDCDAPLILAKDGEGNGFSPAAEIAIANEEAPDA